jgi:serine/arginine repetitive matrix protein 2
LPPELNVYRSALTETGPAGGRVEDWRPIDEHETEINDEGLDATTPVSIDGNENAISQSKKATRDTPEPRTQAPKIHDGCRCQITAADLGECSSGSRKSFETAAQKDSSGQVNVKTEDNAENLTLSRQLSRICAKDMSVLDFATPRKKGKTMDHTPRQLNTIFGRSPLARFPIVVQPTDRLTPGTLTNRVVDSSGGQLLPEGIRQAQLISSPRDKPLRGLKADLWDIDAESMLSELKPEPLQINRQRPRENKDDDRRWSRMFNGLNADVPSSLGMIGIKTSLGSDKAMDHEFAVADDGDDDDDNTVTEGDRTPRASEAMIQNVVNATPAPRGLQRSASTIITPTQPSRRLHHQASYNLDNVEHSGFTPEHRRESTTRGTFPRSGVMLNLHDTQARLRYPLRNPEDSQLSRSLDDTTPKAKYFNGVSETDRYKQNSVKEWVKSIAMTPRRPKIVSHARTEDKRDTYISGAQIASHDILDQQNAQSLLTTSTRDFSQSQKLQKQRPNPRDTPSSTRSFPKQEFDTQGRAQSPFSPVGDQNLPHRRTPSPTEQRTIAVPWTPSSGIGSVLRRRVRSGYSTPATPRTPRTPASPQLAWRPFDDDQPEPPCVSPWSSNNREIKRDREKRIAFFREKAELELEESNLLRNRVARALLEAPFLKTARIEMIQSQIIA